MKFPHLTFLTRFTLVTLAASIVASSTLAFTLESIHQQAVERDETVDAVSQIDARLERPLEHYALNDTLDPVAMQGFRAAQREALLHQYVADLRAYRIDGAAIYPRGTPADAAVPGAARSDGFTIVDRKGIRTVFQPYVTANGRRFVIAVDVLPAELAAQFTGEAWEVVLATIGVIALIACALIALAAGASRELERRRRESQATFVQTLTTLADTIDLRDPYTAGHSKRVAAYSRLLAEDIGLTVHEVEQIESGALMHDIGKVGVPDAVLFKAGMLDAEERMLIRGHPVIGARILRNMPTMSEVVPCILHHHERVDGNGYPDGLAGDEIPIGARVIAVADSFDAMTTDRPYRRGLSVDAAVNELLAQEGKQFDRRLVLAFAELVLRGEIVPPTRATGEVTFGQRPVIEQRLRII